MRGKRTVSAAALLTVALYPLASQGQPPAAGTEDPKVDIVQTVGCVEQRSDPDVTWWLTHAADPEVAGPGPFEEPDVDDARNQEAGSREFQLIGVAEFVDPATQLAWADRALFTTEEQVNATNELQKGRFVLVKGLLIEADESARINLLSVVGLADTCN